MDRQARQVVRAAGGVVGLTLSAAGWLTVAPIVQAIGLKGLHKQHPEYFISADALAAIKAAIAQDTE